MKQSAVKNIFKLFAAAIMPAVICMLIGCSEPEKSTDALLVQAVDAGRSGNWQLCEDNALTVLKRENSNPHALLLRSLAAEHLGKMDIARDSARQAAECDPQNFAAQYSYGRLLALREDSAKPAIKVLERALKLRPKNRNTLILLGQCSSRINSDDTIKYYNALPESVRASPEIQTSIGLYYLERRNKQSRNLDLAFKAFRNAYVKSHDNPGIVLNFALFLDHYVQNRRNAVRFYNHYLMLTEQNPELNPTRALVKARVSSIR